MKRHHRFIFFSALAVASVCMGSIAPMKPQPSRAYNKPFGITRNIMLQKEKFFSRRAYGLHYKGKLIGLFEPTLEKSEFSTFASQSARDWFFVHYYPTFEDVQKALIVLEGKEASKQWPMMTSGDNALAEKDLPKLRRGWVRRLWGWVESLFKKDVPQNVVVRGHHSVKDALEMRFTVYSGFLKSSDQERGAVIQALKELLSQIEKRARKPFDRSHLLYETYMVPVVYHPKDHLMHIHQHRVKTLDNFGNLLHLQVKQYENCCKCFEGVEVE